MNNYNTLFISLARASLDSISSTIIDRITTILRQPVKHIARRNLNFAFALSLSLFVRSSCCTIENYICHEKTMTILERFVEKEGK